MSMYTNFKVGEKNYKLRLGIQQIIDLEKSLGHSLIEELNKFSNNSLPITGIISSGVKFLPSTEFLANVIFYSMQKYQHKIKINDVYSIIDEYVEEGNSMIELMNVVIEILQDSNIIPQEKTNSEEEDNDEKKVK